MPKPKTVLISGGTSGIGQAAVTRLLADGFNVATFSRHASRCAALKKELQQHYPAERWLVKRADVRSTTSLKSILAAVAKKFAPIDILINNAGYGYFSSIERVKIEKFEDLLQTNLVGLVRLTRLVAPQMKRRGQGLIINIASIAGKRSAPEGEFYAATKFGVMGFSDGLRKELAPNNIKVSTICPGMIETNFFPSHVFKRRRKILRQQGSRDGIMAPTDISRIISLICTQSEHSDIQDITIMPF